MVTRVFHRTCKSAGLERAGLENASIICSTVSDLVRARGPKCGCFFFHAVVQLQHADQPAKLTDTWTPSVSLAGMCGCGRWCTGAKMHQSSGALARHSKMKFPLPKNVFPEVNLDRERRAEHTRLAKVVLHDAIDEYDQYNGSQQQRQLNKAQWKPIKSRENVTVYKERSSRIPAHGSEKKWLHRRRRIARVHVLGTQRRDLLDHALPVLAFGFLLVRVKQHWTHRCQREPK